MKTLYTELQKLFKLIFERTGSLLSSIMLKKKILKKTNWLKSEIKIGIAKIASIQHAPKYASFSIVALFATTLLWSIYGASAQQSNSDQLVNSYLFNDSKTFQNAEIPGAHTFLIKWPLFYLVNLFHSSGGSLIALTVIATLLTVGFLALALHRIEKRPLVFGTICLALASVLLLIPAQPIDGAPLPLNMAMLATRNIEYAFFVGGLVLLIKSPKLRSKSFWLGVTALGLLIASDKLFFILAVGGALIALVSYSLAKGWNLVSLSVNWLIGAGLAYAGGLAILSAAKAAHVTQIINQANASPYPLIYNIHDLALGSIYSVLGILSNFGANPAYDAGALKDIPHLATGRLITPAGLVYLVNAFILAIGCFFCWKVIRNSFVHNKNDSSPADLPTKISIVLIWVSLASLLSFIGTKHYYPADGRYLTIFLFTVFIATAASLRTFALDSKKLVWAGMAICLAIVLGIFGATKAYKSEMAATAVLKSRNMFVSKVLSQHKVNTLVGDYWRVIPTKMYLNKDINVMPLSDCTNPRATLTSKAWKRDLNNNSFAYLITFEKSQTDFPLCTLDQIIQAYGRPNASALIAGSQSNPKEMLLFYDNGANKSSPTTLLKTVSTVLPIKLDELPYTSCPTGKSIMNIVAHQDDDLLFMNPDTLHSLQAGDCIRTVYLTAGDAGLTQTYWLGREQGSQAAYSTMESSQNLWVTRIVQISDKAYLNVSHPRSDYKVSLIFVRLPDGNMQGQGFSQYFDESLAKLESGRINVVNSVDNQSAYTKDQLIDALVQLMRAYGVDEIRTQSNYLSKQYPDHSDHMAVSRLAQASYKKYLQNSFDNTVTIPISYYVGYPERELPPNVIGSDFIATEATFLAYAKFDDSVCHSHVDCSKTPTYGSYLSRQYQKPY